MSTPDLSSRYLGLKLRSPWVISSCPLTGDLASLRRLEAAGAAAVVLPSLFQEQVEHYELEVGRLHDTGAFSHSEAANYFPELSTYNTGPDGVMQRIEEAREALSIPVIASLNGISKDGWAAYARRMESAGAHALELNLFHLPTDPNVSANAVEELLVEQAATVASAVEVPVSVKLGPYLSAPAHTVQRLSEVGVRGVALFNRFLEPDIDLEELEVVPRLELSRSAEMRLPLRWIAILRGQSWLSLAATSGVHTSGDAIKLLLAGANVVMVASSLLMHGIEHLEVLARELRTWMEEREYESVAQMRGSMSLENCPDPRAYQRMSYMRALMSFTSGQV